jgi:hypothetical protein
MIPAERLNDVLWDLNLAGLLKPNQRIAGDPVLQPALKERFSWLEWVDDTARSPEQQTQPDRPSPPRRPDLPPSPVAVTRGVYRILRGLRRFVYPVPFNELPLSGIYFFYEEGETAELESAVISRVVRVGTHRENGRYRDRIRQHYGLVKTLGGNKNGSVLRRHLGGALLRRDGTDNTRLAEWLKHGGQSYPDVERRVSEVLRTSFSFSCVRVDDKDERLDLESQLIALLAQHPLGGPSADWLGQHATPPIPTVGLWNVQHLHASPLGPEGLRRLEELSA